MSASSAAGQGITAAPAYVTNSIGPTLHCNVLMLYPRDRIAAKLISRFHWNLVLWSGLPTGRAD